MNEKLLISIIVPVYNSSAIMPTLLEAIEKERITNNWNLELLLINDGSKDDSYQQICEMAKKYSFVRGFNLSRNFGHQAAVSIGLERCRGDYIAIIDDDLQDPPSLLPGFFKYLDEGYDVAYGVRRKRKENFIKVACYEYFYKILRLLSEVEMPLDSGDFCVMKKRVVKSMLDLHERNPFLRGMRSWVGYKQIGVEYERGKRADGESGYTISKLFKIASDGIFSFSNLPLRVTTFLGGIGFSAAFLYSVYILTKKIIFGIYVEGFVTIILMILFFGSLNLLCLGIIGEYIARIYSQGKNRPHAIIAESTGD